MERGAGSYLARTLSGNGVERHHLRVSSFSLLSLYSALGLPPAICSSFSRYRLPLYGHCFSATVLSIRFLLSSFFLSPVLCQDTAYLVTVTVFTIPLYVQLFTNTNPFYAKENTYLFTVTVFTIPLYGQLVAVSLFYAKELAFLPLLFSRYHFTVKFFPVALFLPRYRLPFHRYCFHDTMVRSTFCRCPLYGKENTYGCTAAVSSIALHGQLCMCDHFLCQGTVYHFAGTVLPMSWYVYFLPFPCVCQGTVYHCTVGVSTIPLYGRRLPLPFFVKLFPFSRHRFLLGVLFFVRIFLF